MTLFASVAIFRRNGQMTFKAPRKEASGIITQARKSASRFWNGNIREPDKLLKVVVVSSLGNTVTVAENSGARRWVSYSISLADAATQPHLSACLIELGVDAKKAPPPMPDVLEINGIVYRREI